jgi:hypothetical protein
MVQIEFAALDYHCIGFAHDGSFKICRICHE